MQKRRLFLLVTASVITIGVIAWLIIQRSFIPQPPFSFIPTSDDLIHRQVELKEEIPGMPASCRIYSFPADFNSICLQADAELLSQDYKGPVRFTSPINGEEMRLYTCTERVSDTGSARSVRIVNDRISERKWRADDHYSVRVGWVTVEVIDMALTLPLPQSLVDEVNRHIDVNQEK